MDLDALQDRFDVATAGLKGCVLGKKAVLFCVPVTKSVRPLTPPTPATGFVGRAATGDRGSAGGIYLASYFCGGLVGSFVLGRAFDAWGWSACVAGVGAALAAAAALAFMLRLPGEVRARAESVR